jgi:hypothetical protein
MARPWKELGRYGGVGIDLVLSILILGGIGHWLDARYGRGSDWGMLIGFLLGVAVGVRNLVRVAARMQKDIERAEAADPRAHRWVVDESWVYRDEGLPSPKDSQRNRAPGDSTSEEKERSNGG